eukprot:TRINITY_DN5337_c0_g2_i2.p1 TRINITY_DN5337_c0_g2~~TRINITY_DN5337_c0_g2_i2.p1  ORF type:complete len:527 (+),score=62.24 TRINITY_DN5337_c0_g2_i2:78-1658(+)
MCIRDRLILSLIKGNRVSSEVLASVKEAVRGIKDENKRLEKISEIILRKYDINIQMMNEKKKLAGDESPLLIKTIARLDSGEAKSANSGSLKRHTKHGPNKEGSMQKLLIGMKRGKINETVALINRYADLAFRNKSGYYDMKLIHDLHHALSLGRRYQCEEEIKSRERAAQIKEKLLRLLYSTINKENGVVVEGVGTPGYCVKNGNNSSLVRVLFKERWWWTPAEDLTCNLLWTQWKDKRFIEALGTAEVPIKSLLPKISNHLEGNHYLGHKKNMHKCLVLYYSLIGKNIAEIVPLTFHIKQGRLDKEYKNFESVYHQRKAKGKNPTSRSEKNLWILKPGENSNRGNGITVTKNLSDIAKYIADSYHTCIIQKYIERPLLFERRKFDIRCFALVTSVNGWIKGYYYRDGYLRTSSKEYSAGNSLRSVHLTNEAVQIKYDDFGKHEAGNKISYADFQKYLEGYLVKSKSKQKVNFYKDILPKIKVCYSITVEHNSRNNKICFHLHRQEAKTTQLRTLRLRLHDCRGI